MPKYLTKEEVEKDFDETYDLTHCEGCKCVNPNGQLVKDSIKSFIHSLRLADKQALLEEINEWAEKNKKMCYVSDTPQEIYYNQALHDLQAFIKSKI